MSGILLGIFSPQDVPVGTLFKYKNAFLDRVCIGEVVFSHGVGRNVLMLWDIEGPHERGHAGSDYRLFPCIKYNDLVCLLD